MQPSQSTPGNFVPPLLSPSLHEGVFDNVAGDFTIAAVKATLGAGRLAAESARNACLAVFGDETLSEGAKHVRSADLAFQVTRPALAKFDSTTERVANEIAAVERKLRGPPPPPTAVAAEVRNAFRALSPKERTKAIHLALQEGDEATIASLLDGPLMLVGMTAIERELLRLRWAKERLPSDLARLEELQKAAVHCERGGRLLLEYSMKMADPAIVGKAKASQLKAAQAIAAATAA
jgi:hypothetical protein